MKKRVLLVSAAALSTLAFAGGNVKVKVVHKGEVIEVSENAVAAHLGHGDSLFVPDDGGMPNDKTIGL